MAVSRGTSSGPDWLDLADAVRAFQDQNRVTITVGIVLVETKGMPDLLVDAQAWGWEEKLLEPKVLASVKSQCSVTKLKSLEGVLFQLMYALDFQLALREMEGEYQAAKADPGAK